MASSRERQRKLARAKMERQMARRAARARRTRQLYAGVAGAVALIVVLVGGLWLGGVFSGKKHSKNQAVASDCLWTKADTATNKNLKDVGDPPTTGIPKSGTETMTITTSVGTVTATLDLAKAPCTAASFRYLGGKGFFDKTTCHRLLEAADDHVLQCGDPSGTGSGGPGYTFEDEYLPTNPQASAAPNCSSPSAADSVTYPGGSIAMANSGVDTNGSQFFIVYKDSKFPPCYTLFGTITSGLKLIQGVGAAGDDGAFASGAGGGHPKKAVTINSLTVSAPTTANPSASSASPSPVASASASGQSASPSPAPQS